jgi:thiol-disulfide isomerase/thioredoxin
MSKLSTGFVIVAALACMGATSTPGALHIFGASWCAPCVAELRDIRRIAAAAAPSAVLIVWEDEGIARFTLPAIENVTVVSKSQARQMIASRAGRTAGLPYAMMADSNGVRCSDTRRQLSPEAVVRLKAQCVTARFLAR